MRVIRGCHTRGVESLFAIRRKIAMYYELRKEWRSISLLADYMLRLLYDISGATQTLRVKMKQHRHDMYSTGKARSILFDV